MITLSILIIFNEKLLNCSALNKEKFHNEEEKGIVFFFIYLCILGKTINFELYFKPARYASIKD
jgi:hypothetical protein